MQEGNKAKKPAELH